MLDLKFRDPISQTMCHDDIQSVLALLSRRSFQGEASLLALLRDLPGHMGYQLCFTSTHKPLLSTKLCTARNKTKREGKKTTFKFCGRKLLVKSMFVGNRC